MIKEQAKLLAAAEAICQNVLKNIRQGNRYWSTWIRNSSSYLMWFSFFSFRKFALSFMKMEERGKREQELKRMSIRHKENLVFGEDNSTRDLNF